MTLPSISDNDSALTASVQEEIGMLRTLIHRMSRLCAEGQSLEELAKVINPFSIACNRLGTLLKIDRMLAGGEKEDALAEFLKTLNEEMEG